MVEVDESRPGQVRITESRIDETMLGFVNQCRRKKTVIDDVLRGRGYYVLVDGQSEVVRHLTLCADDVKKHRYVKWGYSSMKHCFCAGFRKGELDREATINGVSYNSISYLKKLKAYRAKVDTRSRFGVPKAYEVIAKDVAEILERMVYLKEYAVERAFNVGYTFGVDYVECMVRGVDSEYLREAIENTKVPYSIKGQ